MYAESTKEDAMSSVTLFTVRGIPVRVHPSWLAVYGLIAWTPVREVMRAIIGQVTATPNESLWHAFEKVSQNGLGRVAVVEDGRLAGYLSVKDAAHVLAIAGR
jgi:CBS domain-containing protein